MAAPAKKREIDSKLREDDESNSGNNHSDKTTKNINDEQENKIMVDFVGRIPEDTDFHGIKKLLQQLFLKAHISVSALADYIISRNYVGSVVKQELDDDEDDDEDNDNDEVYGVTSIINISHGQNEECIQQLRTLLKDLSDEFATDTVNTMIKNILENDSAPLGLIINERFVNIPVQISVPLFENLIADMKRATAKKMPYNFQYYILIAKLYKPKATMKTNTKKKAEEPEIVWSNQEEEVFNKNAMCSFEFPVDKESDTGLSGTWTEDDVEIIPYRRIMVLEASKLPTIIEEIKKFITN